jgi:hypothetical protein
VKLARSSVAALAVAAVGLLGACTSQPSARAVAEDVVEALNEEGELTNEQRDCLLEKIDGYTDEQLAAIGSPENQAINYTQPSAVEQASPEFQEYVENLSECMGSS